MAIKHTKQRKAVTLLKTQWKLIEAEAERRGLSVSKLIEFTLRNAEVIK
jgi:predicted DNA-binding ribbon-helix-helix protein